MRPAIALFAGAVIVACIVFAAIPHLAAPDWTVTVVDLTGKPMRGIRVYEVYRDFHCDSNDHERTASADDLGVAHFEPQYEHRNPLDCILYTISNVQAPAHAGSRSVASVFAFGPGGEAVSVDSHGNHELWTGSPLRVQSRITIRY